MLEPNPFFCVETSTSRYMWLKQMLFNFNMLSLFRQISVNSTRFNADCFLAVQRGWEERRIEYCMNSMGEGEVCSKYVILASVIF